MRELTVKYDGECRRCGAALSVGGAAMYEKSMGVFCPGHEPTTTDEIRKFRTAKAQVKADKYNGWAEKREANAGAALNSHPEYRHDWAFITQPGHIPARSRMIAADDRAYESLRVAKGLREKAGAALNVRVVGDAERGRQQIREARDHVISKGAMVIDFAFGVGEVVQVCKKSYRIKFASGYTCARDKSYVRGLPTDELKT